MKKIVKIKIANGIKVTKRDNESHFNKIHFLITNYNKLWQNKLDQINYTKNPTDIEEIKYCPLKLPIKL